MVKNCGWETVDGFASESEYRQLLTQLNEQVQAGAAKQIAIPSGQGWGTAWKENWYLCPESNDIWRLVAPDPPFRGIFKLIEAEGGDRG